SLSYFLYHHPSTSEIFPLSLHDALPILYCPIVFPTQNPEFLLAHLLLWIFFWPCFSPPEANLHLPSPRCSFRERFLGFFCMPRQDRKSTRLNSSHVKISYAVFCLKKKKK